MPALSLPRVGEEDLVDVFMGAIGIVLVLVAETLAAGRTFAAKHGYEIVPNQELFAMGAANLASGFMGGMIVGGGIWEVLPTMPRELALSFLPLPPRCRWD